MPAIPENSMRELDAMALEAMHEADVPGLAIAVAAARRSILVAVYGWADVEARREVTTDTLFMLGSTAKPVVAMVIGALVDRGMLSVDEDVERWLGFPARNPAFPDAPITLRLLLQHRSGIQDDLDAMRASVVAGDSGIDLANWLSARLADPRAFTHSAPGVSELYTNTGWALAALVAERAANMGFDALCEVLVLRPLGMTRASWHLGSTEDDDLARPYAGGFGEPLRPVAHYGYPDYPSGSLRASASELAVLLRCVAGRGTFGGRTIVSAEWMEAVEHGLGWRRLGESSFGHDGLDRGVGTRIAVNRASRCAVAILGNAAWTHPEARAGAFTALEKRLFEIGASAGDPD